MLNFIQKRKDVNWDGEVVATVRGLSTNDAAVIMVHDGEQVLDLFDALADGQDFTGAQPAEILASLDADFANIMGRVMRKCPLLVARIIAVATVETESELENAVESVKDHMPIALQVKILSEVANQTFGGSEGIRDFLGNLQAVIGAANAVTGQPNAQPERKDSPSSLAEPLVQ